MRAALAHAATSTARAAKAPSLVPPARNLSPTRAHVQAKLTIGPVDDPLEREADRVADAVVAGQAAAPSFTSVEPRIQRQPPTILPPAPPVKAPPTPAPPVSLPELPPIITTYEVDTKTDAQKLGKGAGEAGGQAFDTLPGKAAQDAASAQLERDWNRASTAEKVLMVGTAIGIGGAALALLKAIPESEDAPPTPEKTPRIKISESFRVQLELKLGWKDKAPDGTETPRRSPRIDAVTITLFYTPEGPKGPPEAELIAADIARLEASLAPFRPKVTKDDPAVRYAVRKMLEQQRQWGWFGPPWLRGGQPEPGRFQLENPFDAAKNRSRVRLVPELELGTIQRKCAACEDEDKHAMRKAAGSVPAAGVASSTGPASVALPSLGGGSPLPSAVRAAMEPRFGRSLADVRVHTGADAANSATALNARAYTLGRDIAFAPGQYRPFDRDGQRLLAHELAHVVQQGAGAAAVVRRQGAANTCTMGNCRANSAIVAADLTRATGYVDAAFAALEAAPLAPATTRALDWYFNDHGAATVATVRQRLGCIKDCLDDTSTHSRFGCDPGYNALAYVRMGQTAPCTHVLTDVCVTNQHFGTSDRIRAETVIHECAHRVGMSLGAPASVPDIYENTARFLTLGTSEALLNSDSYALFAGAIVGGVPLSLLVPFTLGGGVAGSPRGPRTWYARLYLGTEFQHPILGIFNPTLGVGVSLIGDTAAATPGTVKPAEGTLMFSLLPGIRIGDPRPGGAGGLYVSLFGGPAIALSGTKTEIGAEAGAAAGYRWRWLDISASVGGVYDPTRQIGLQHLYTAGLSVSFPLGIHTPGK